MQMIKTIRHELALTRANPKRVAGLFNLGALRRLKHRFVIGVNRHGVKEQWQPTAAEKTDGQFKSREYNDYDQYVAHQRSKLAQVDLKEYDVMLRKELGQRIGALQSDGLMGTRDAVLCLAARIGSEVKAFIDNGCFAVGIDLNPGEDNKYVVVGDFHALQYADGSIDAAYTNSLDHAFDIEKIASELRRVLRPGGLLIIDAVRGSDKGMEPEFYASFWWQSTDDLCARFKALGFELVREAEIEKPFSGRQLCLRNANTTGKAAAE